MSCPIKSSNQWKSLEREFGPKKAFEEFISSGNKSPFADKVRSNKNAEVVLTAILDNLQERFGYPYKIISNQEMSDVTGLPLEDMTRGYIDKDAVYINRDNLSVEAAFHEYAHVLIEYMDIVKPQVVAQMFADLSQSKTGMESVKKVMSSKTYIEMGHYNPKTGEFSERGKKEAIVTAIGKLAEQDFREIYDEPAFDENIITKLRKFIAEVGQMVLDSLGIDIRITPKTFNEKTTIADLSLMMVATDAYLDIRDNINETIDMSSEYLTESDLNKHNKIFDDIKIFIEERFRRLANSNVAKKNRERFRLEKIKEVYEENSSKLKKLNHIIDYAFGELYTKKGKGFVSYIDELIEEISTGKKMDPHVAIEKLQAYNEFAKQFSQLFEQIRKPLMLTMDRDQYISEIRQEGSPLWKIEQVITALTMIEVKQEYHIIPALAAVLYPYYSKMAGNKAIQEIDTRLAGLRSGLARIEKQSTKESRNVFENISYNSIKRQIDQLTNEKKRLDPSYENLVQQLREAPEDISYFDLKLTPAVSSSDPVIATFANMLKTKFERMRIRLLDYQRDIKKAIDDYRKSTGLSLDNPTKFNEGMFEKIRIYRDGKFVEVMSFVNEVDMSKYSEDKAAMYDEYNYLKKIGKKEEADNVLNNFYKTAHTALPWDEITRMIDETEKLTQPDSEGNTKMTKGEFYDFIVKNMYNAEISKQVQAEYEMSNMSVDEKYKRLAERLIELHKKRGNIRYQRAFTEINKSRYVNQNYQTLKSNPAKFKYHNVLLNQYLNDQQLLPQSQRLGYILPQVRKQGWERYKDKGFSDYLVDQFMDTVSWMENDQEVFGMGPESYEQRFLPIYYTGYIEPENTSTDLARSVLLFSKMANRYAELDQMREVIGAMEDIVQKREVRTTTPEGTGILNKFKKSLNIEEPILKKGKDANINQLLESFIQMQVYGEKQKTQTINIAGKTINLGKLANSLSSWVSKATIGGDFLKAVANASQAKIMTFIEAAGGEVVDAESFRQGEAMYMSEVLPDILNKDFGKGIPESFHGRMIEAFDPLQGEWENAFGKKITRSKLLRTLSWDTHFMGIHAGEHYAQVGLMYGMLHYQKVDINGQQVPLIKAYQQNPDGSIGLKPGVDPEWAIGGKKMLKLQAKLHGMNKRLHGVYNDFDYLDAQRDAIGRLVLMFRKFAPPGFKRRFKRFGINHETGMVDEGFYNTFFNAMIRQRHDLINLLLNNESDFTDFQKANIRRAILEMTAMIMTGVAVSLIGGLDDDDTYGKSFAEYQFTRLNSELMFYINPLDFMRIMSSPSASTTKIEQLAKAINYTFFTWDPEKLEYQRKQGMWEKGDSKTMAAWLKLMGVTGYNLHPEEAVKILNMNR